jgi:hypothetical protein
MLCLVLFLIRTAYECYVKQKQHSNKKIQTTFTLKSFQLCMQIEKLFLRISYTISQDYVSYICLPVIYTFSLTIYVLFGIYFAKKMLPNICTIAPSQN